MLKDFGSKILQNFSPWRIGRGQFGISSEEHNYPHHWSCSCKCRDPHDLQPSHGQEMNIKPKEQVKSADIDTKSQNRHLLILI